MADEILLEKRKDRVAVLTLNRPQALNAINRAMVAVFRQAIRDVEADPAIDVLVLTGAGERSFCVGVDLKERQTLDDEEAQVFRMVELFPMYREFEARQKPAIALVHGHALGGGFELALACDMIIATTQSKFGLPEVKWGLIPAGGGCQKLPKLIGAARAKEVILAGSGISAVEAERLGIINRVAPRDSCMDEAIALAGRIVANVQVAVRGARRCIDHALDAPVASAYDLEVANQCYAAQERKDGIDAFVSRKSEKTKNW